MTKALVRKKVQEAVEAIFDATTPGSSKNVYEAYDTHKESALETNLVSLCTKVAGNPMLPKAPTPRLNMPGASAGVGKWNPLRSSVGRPPAAPGVKTMAPTDSVNPNRNIQQAMSAFTSRKSTT